MLAVCITTAGGLFASQDIDPADYIRYPQVQAYVKYFTTGEMKTWLESVLDRGSLYNGYISGKIEEFSVPEELKYLPIIESGYNPRAVSPSGAAGLWQFMMNSIDPYNLVVNDWIDERRDFWKSTAASLKKLAYNNSVLGDWLLAIAAYNCGLNRLKAAIEESDSRDFWELAEKNYLPVETKRYIPKFLAVAYIANNAKEYGITLPEDTDWQWRRIQLEGQINLRLLTNDTGIPANLIALGNAELEYDVTPPSEYSYHLKVPSVYTDVIDRFLQGEIYALNGLYVHRVRSGDTLSGLSTTYGVSLEHILRQNPGIRPRFLQINETIVIPALHSTYPYQQSPIGPFLGLNEPVRRGRRNNLPIHTVEEGDTLWDIAKKYSTSVNELLGANELIAEKPIMPGQILHIPVEEGEILTR